MQEFGKRLDKEWDKTILPEAGKDGINQEQFHALVERIDSALRAYPATAQVAKQQGEHLAALLNAANGNKEIISSGQLQPFSYSHKGSLAYIGSDAAVMDMLGGAQAKGVLAGWAWNGFEAFSQISWINKLLVSFDWVCCLLGGT